MAKKVSAIFLLLSAISFGQTMLASAPVVLAAQLRDVVISEVAWAGSADSSSDEWLELYNNTNQSIDLNNWSVEDDNGAQTYPLQGSIAAHSYFLVESRETATSIPGDVIKSTSLSNSGDSLVLKDASQPIVDTVNSTSGAWFAGSATTHASMERIDLQADGDQAGNWHTAASISTATSSNGGHIVGTPKAQNSSSSGNSSTTQSTSISTTTAPNPPSNNQDISVTVSIQNASNISNYGFDINYDPAALSYINTTEGDFLKAQGPLVLKVDS